MIRKISLVVLCAAGVSLPTLAQAQLQKGYSGDLPDVTVDRSVLEDLKGYKPPPMFGSPTPQINKPDTAKESLKETPLQNAPTLTSPELTSSKPPITKPTSPDAEELLRQPIKNHHVLTERNTSMTAPTSDVMDDTNLTGPLLPLPGNLAPSKPAEPQKIKKEVEKKSEKSPAKSSAKDTPQKADKKQVDNAKNKAETKKPLPPVASPTKPSLEQKSKLSDVKPVPMPKVKPPTNAYRPQAPQTMPAMPSIKVEKNELAPLSSNSPLPVLPPTTDKNTVVEKPSIGLRMMDAALERQMETDPSKIKEQLSETKVKTLKSSDTQKPLEQTSTKPKQIIPKNTLVFKENEINLSKTLEGQIRSFILPALTKDKNSKIQILSFATSADNQDSSARRIALSRALEIRDFLKASKIDLGRIDVKALANGKDAVPANKVDIITLK